MAKLRFSVWQPGFARVLGLHILQHNHDGSVGEAQPLDFKLVDPKTEGGEWSDAVVKMTMDEAQELLDQLIYAGLRPTQRLEPDAAQTAHLEDMRKIAFQLLDENAGRKPL